MLQNKLRALTELALESSEDEPMNGLDNRGMEDIRRLLLHLKEQGVTILLASHNPLDISVLYDAVFEMDRGEIRRVK